MCDNIKSLNLQFGATIEEKKKRRNIDPMAFICNKKKKKNTQDKAGRADMYENSTQKARV